MPIVSTGNSYTNLLTSTMEMIVPGLQDNIFDDLPLWKKLNSRGGVRKNGSGESIQYSVEYAQQTQQKSYSGYDILDTTPHEFMMRTIYNWKEYATPITISGIDKAKNSGSKTKILDLLGEKASNATSSLRDDLSVDTYGAGTENDSKVIVGLQGLVADTPTTGTVGSLDSSVYTWWRNQYTNSAGSFAGGGLGYMRTMYNKCTFGSKQPDMLVTTQDVHEFYEGSLQPQARFASTDEADGGFITLLFKRKPVFFDRDCGSGRMYFLNLDHLRLDILGGFDFKTTPFVTPADQDVAIAQLMFKGALTTGNRRMHGVITGITA